MRFDKIKNYLNQPVDNTALIVFRMAFGLLIVAECFGAILLGWVKRVFIEPQFTFSFIGFEWIQPLPGNGMYYYFGVMGVLGMMIMIGFYYRYSLSLFTLLWWGVYLMQKTSYNNHYYLLILLCFLMLLVPAHHNASLDAYKRRVVLTTTCPRWCIEIFKWQLLIVFTFAALAKLYPGWIKGDFISFMFSTKSHYPLIGDLLQEYWLQRVVILGGIAYDLTIIPMMYWAKTRKFGLVISVVFHLFNSVVFGIGIFPYLMIASLVLFFPVGHWRPKIPGYIDQVQIQPQAPVQDKASIRFKCSTLSILLAAYFIWQLWLPVRHYFIPGDVFKTEEGHRMAWRMMLRSKHGRANFTLVNKQNGESWVVSPQEYLTEKQAYRMAAHPDMIWQFTRYLAKVYAKQGTEDLEIYVTVNAFLNGKELTNLIDPKLDLLSVEWNRFGHNEWVTIDY